MPTARTRRTTAPAARRTNEEITAETRRALLAAGRRLFGQRGYEAVSADAIGDAAGLTRGALHYQFGDKRGLFVAVLDELLAELTERIARETMENLPEGPEELERGALLLLDAYGLPEVQRILLQDAPHVLGLLEWREMHDRSGLAALLGHALSHWVEAGMLEASRTDATRRLLLGALMHAGIVVAGSGDAATTLAEFREPIRRMIRGFASGPGKTPRPPRSRAAKAATLRPALRRKTTR
jgi:AcrR family transcriptional regulator